MSHVSTWPTDISARLRAQVATATATVLVFMSSSAATLAFHMQVGGGVEVAWEALNAMLCFWCENVPWLLGTEGD